MKKEKVLVTGASGFIGSHLVEELIKKGYSVVCLVLPGEEMTWIKHLNVQYFYGDVTNKKTLYLAGLLGGYDFSEMCHVNYGGIKNLLEVCLDLNICLKRFLFTSSVAAVGPTKKDEILDEGCICNPVTDYGKSKLMAEELLPIVGDKIPYTILRLPLVYGPRSIGGLFTCFKLINKGIELNIGKTESNVAFIKDVIEGMIMASESPTTVNQTYCLGEDRIFNCMEIFKIIKHALGRRTIRIRFPYILLYSLAFFFELYAKITGTYPILRRRNVALYIKYRYWRFSMRKAKIDFNFEAKVQLERGAKITADWYKHNQWI